MDEMERLAYQNRFVRQLVQTLDYSEADCEGKTPQIISGPDNLVILRVSLEEWIKLTSSVFTGADICYPEESDSVRWTLFRAVECPVDLCELMAECLSTSEAFKQALRDFMANDPEMQQITSLAANRGVPAPGTTLVSTTDYDALFGAITFLVDTMYDAIVDFNGLAELTTNLRERGALLFEAIPVLETAPLDEIAEFIDQIYENVMEVFDGQWTTTPETGSRDRIRCGLFCIAKNNGGDLTWEMVADYFWEQVGFVPGGPVIGVAGQFVAFFITGNWTGQAVVDISFANFATAMTAGQKFGDLLFPNMSTIMALGLDNPDPDWEILCTECDDPPDPSCTDFTTSQGTWSINSGNGSWTLGQGFAGLFYAGFNSTAMWVDRSAGTGTINKIVVKFNEGVSNLQLLNTPSSPTLTYNGAAVTEIEFSATTFGTWVNRDGGYVIALRMAQTGNRSTLRMTEVCVYTV